MTTRCGSSWIRARAANTSSASSSCPRCGVYQDILAAAEGADLLVSHVLTYATRLVAEKLGIPWASAFLQPLGFFSAYDPPVLSNT